MRREIATLLIDAPAREIGYGFMGIMSALWPCLGIAAGFFIYRWLMWKTGNKKWVALPMAGVLGIYFMTVLYRSLFFMNMHAIERARDLSY